jgi:choline transport protein
VIAFLINAYLTRLLPLVTQSALYWSIAGWLIISITILSCASPDFQTGHFVYGEFINETGWPDGLSWLLGLLQGSFSLTAFDAVAHCVEELGNATVDGPRIMIGSVLIGVFTGFIYLSVLLFCAKDIDTVISSAAGPVSLVSQSVFSWSGAGGWDWGGGRGICENLENGSSTTSPTVNALLLD